MNQWKIIITGIILGTFGVLLAFWGNPGNMGYCIACFLRDITGAIGLHRADKLQYLRPEIIGLAIGATGSALFYREFRPVGGSSPFTRFFLGIFTMIGMLVFLGCPLRTLLRLGAGDLNALVGLVGLIAGVLIGIQFLKRGFSLGRAVSLPKINGYLFPLFSLTLLLFLLFQPTFIFFSSQGPGSQHAPIIISLIAGLIVGILAQRTRLCMVGGIRDYLFFRDTYLLKGFIAILATVFLGSLFLGKFNLGFYNQPLAHTEAIWNFLGMLVAGLGAVLLGGCPLRQLTAAGEGNSDAGISILGLIFGAAIAHNFGLAAGPSGVPIAGKFAVIIALIFMILTGFSAIAKKA